MAVDLHLHSMFSDGTDPPERIVAAAADRGLTAIALTDHDNLDGIARARLAAHDAGIGLIAGTELSVEWRSGGMHLLVYFLEPSSGPLQDRLNAVQAGRVDRNKRIAQRLAELGIEVTYPEVVAEAGGTGVGRPHFAAMLVQKGYANSIADAFDHYLGVGRPAYLPRDRIAATEAIELARASGAVPVIAHPHTLGVSAEDYGGAFEDLAAIGLGGIEAYYSEYRPEVRAHIAGICADLGIAATGGSDYHGAYKPGLQVGLGKGDLVVPEKAVAQLEEQRQLSH